MCHYSRLSLSSSQKQGQPWKISSGRVGESSIFFDLVYLDPAIIDDFSVLDLFDYVRQGVFDMVHIVLSADTWSRSRNAGFSGQRPLRSRTSLLGLSTLNPTENEKINSANHVLEILTCCAGQVFQCSAKSVRSWRTSPVGPSSIWALREFQLLEGIYDARRAAGFGMPGHRSRSNAP